MSSATTYPKSPLPVTKSLSASSKVCRVLNQKLTRNGTVIRHDIYLDDADDSDASVCSEDTCFVLQPVPLFKKRRRAEQIDPIDPNNLIKVGESASSTRGQPAPFILTPSSKGDIESPSRSSILGATTGIFLLVAFQLVFNCIELSLKSIRQFHRLFSESSSNDVDPDHSLDLDDTLGPSLDGSILRCACLCCSTVHFQFVGPPPQNPPGYNIPHIYQLPGIFHARILSMIAESPEMRIEEIVRTLHKVVPLSVLRNLITPWGVFEFLRNNNDEDVLRNTPNRQSGAELLSSGLLHHLWYHSDLSVQAIQKTLQTRHGFPHLTEKELVAGLEEIGVTSGRALWDIESFQHQKRTDRLGAIRTLNNGWLNGMSNPALLQYLFEMGFYHLNLSDIERVVPVCQAVFGHAVPLEELLVIIKNRRSKDRESRW